MEKSQYLGFLIVTFFFVVPITGWWDPLADYMLGVFGIVPKLPVVIFYLDAKLLSKLPSKELVLKVPTLW